MGQLNTNNIKSVSIKKLQVRGELVKETPIQFPGEKNPANVKYFETTLPSFQGEGLIARLQEKNVIITVESDE
jgi:cell division protease FtsH